MAYHMTLVILLLACLVSGLQAIDWENPVRTAAEDEIKSLPGLSYEPNFKHYSGYLNADTQKNRFWHYWFVESQSNPDTDPLVLWLNGGPGCSSLLGLLTELGPYSVDRDGQIRDNKYAWNKHANVIFMESPAGVGFSYAADGSVKANDDSTAQQNHQALVSFFEKFPQYKNRPLYLTGESYGGVYLPTLAVLVDRDSSMNLKGVAIGNGYLDVAKLSESLIFFAYHHGIVGKSFWSTLSQHCCDGKPPARGQCNFLEKSRTFACARDINEALIALYTSGLNPYNLYDRCAQPGESTGKSLGREHFDKSLLMQAFNMTHRSSSSERLSTETEFSLHESVKNSPPCTDDSIVVNYLNRKDVKDALHIPAKLTKPFSSCFDKIKYTQQYPAQEGGLAPFIKKLIESQRKLTLLIYNGDTDMVCNFLGDEWFVDDLNDKVLADYHPWMVDNQVAGFMKTFNRITYMTVKGSGHMVPTDRPVEALHMFEKYLLKIEPSQD